MWSLVRDHSSALSPMPKGYLFLLALGFFMYCVNGNRNIEETGTIADGKLTEAIDNYFYKKISKKISDFGLENSQNNCSQKLAQFWNDLDSGTKAAYLDSFGKIGPGILTGNIVYLGYYDECTDIANTDYCRFPFDVTLTTNTAGQSVTIPFEFGMCFPSSCDAYQFYELFFIDSNELFSNTSDVEVSIEYSEPHCPWRDLDWTTSSIIMLTVCILFIALVIIGTLVDALLWFISDTLPKLHLPVGESPVTTTDSTFSDTKNSINNDRPTINEDEPLINAKPKLKQPNVAKMQFIEFLKDLILSFSLYKTVPVIMSTKQPPNAITSINGMRVIGMCWIILGHTFMWGLGLNVIANALEMANTYPQRFSFQVIMNGFFSVDIFFVLSGLLMSYLSIKEMERRKGKFPFLFYYVHRLLRLSPGYYFALFLLFKILPHVGSGPLWFLGNVHRCDHYWWTNILYINNFYPTVYSDQCYTITWYLANDMQFFIVSPIFMLLLYHSWELGICIIFGTMFLSIAVTGTLAGIDNSNANLLTNYVPRSNNDNAGSFPIFEFSSIYQKPYCRINAFLIGIVLGFVLYKNWKIKFNFWIRLSIYIALWMIAVASVVTIVFGQYQTWHGHPFSKSENVMYFMFSHSVFSIGIALMIYACHNGFGGVINSILSWSFWIPPSRLTFMAYLSHPIVLDLIFGTLRFRFIYTDWILILYFSAAVLLTYSLALVLAVVVEYPLANVESVVYKFIGIQRRK